jgi:hypothetical protein
MRRIATVALATGVALAGLGAVATTADAATHSWVTKDGWKSIKAGGTYSRTSTYVSIKGWLQDTSNNGWSPAVQFQATEGSKAQRSYVFYFTVNGKLADFAFKHSYGHFFTSKYTSHLYVREVAVKETNRNTVRYGAWKKLY